MTEFDHIIVGAGAAGCVLAYRLSEDPNNKVLLVEAGPTDSNPFIHIPLGVGKTLGDPKLMWYFPTEPDEGNGGQPRMWVRGKVLGGSSSVNGMIYCRGQPEDYDGWAAAGATGWGWDEMSRCFREMEDHALGADELRGAGGPLHVSRQPYKSDLTEGIIAAGRAAGWPVRDDLNRLTLDGIAYTIATMKNGRRMSAADAFLRPALRRPNLTVVTDCPVETVLFEGRRAIGIRCGGAREFRARRDVILSAGALQSPKLLMLSGVGPAAELQALGIPVVADRPEVGRNLREHKSVTVQYRLKRPAGHNRETRGLRLALNVLKYALWRGGSLASTCEVVSFFRTRPEIPRADIEAIFWCLSLDLEAAGLAIETLPGVMCSVVLLRPESTGSLRLRSADPAAPPLIYSNFLSAEADRRSIIDGVRQVRAVLESAPLAHLVAEETAPGAQFRSDAEILAAARNGDTMAHASGTCRMGGDPDSVLDARLRVRGVEGLRVMDTSVMPTQVSGNTNGPTMAMAWRAAELIR